MPRTPNDPLRIAEIDVLAGKIGITFAPGKKQLDGLSGVHDRVLAADLDAIAAWDAAAVITLVGEAELVHLQIPDLGREVKARFMEWHHWPIVDQGIPNAAFDAAWPERSHRLRTLLGSGGRILIHCMGGLGRAGSIAARLLVDLGMAPEAAISAVRAVRPGALETRRQEIWAAGNGAPVLHDHFPHKNAADARQDRALGALLGLAVGDAVGTTLEFTAKPKFMVLDEMVGGGPFGLEVGQWTDDTAMALALADSLLAAPELDPQDLMQRFCSWHRDGAYSCTGTCFDIGNTTRSALRRFLDTGDPVAGLRRDDQSGNGALMRLSPVAIRHWSDLDEMLRIAALQTRTTHGSDAAVEASCIFAEMLSEAIAGASLPEILSGSAAARIEGGVTGVPRRDIRGSGYVVHSLQAAVWAVARTTSFRSAVLLAANLGEDADTTAAIAGQLAGALYGASGIPEEWLERLAWRDRIERAALDLFLAGAPAEREAAESRACSGWRLYWDECRGRYPYRHPKIPKCAQGGTGCAKAWLLGVTSDVWAVVRTISRRAVLPAANLGCKLDGASCPGGAG